MRIPIAELSWKDITTAEMGIIGLYDAEVDGDKKTVRLYEPTACGDTIERLMSDSDISRLF